MFAHVWHAHVELQGCGQRAGVVAITDDAEHDHVNYGVGFGRSASVRGAPLHLLPVVGILQSFRVRRHFFLTVIRKFTILIALRTSYLGCC